MAKRKQVTVNRKYKDTVFRMLFSDKKNLLSLYNAVSGTAYTDPEELEIVTLENAVYMGMKNDLAFIIDTNLFLYEHQSTYNPNMPLRDLFYVASEYQKLVDTKSLYSSKLQKVPAPKFLVFYNGIQEMEDSRTEYLSAAFENLKGDADLELKVTTLNICKGHNKKLMDQCKVLKEYAQYVEKVRMYREEMELDEAVSRAIKECIQENILAEFLRQNRAEVEKVSIFEYDKEEEERKLREAEYEAGKEDGIQTGIQTGMIQMAKMMGLKNEEIELLLQKKLQQQNRAEMEKVSIFEYDKEEEERKLRQAEFEAGKEDGIQIGMIRMAKIMGLKDKEIELLLQKELGMDESTTQEMLRRDKDE